MSNRIAVLVSSLSFLLLEVPRAEGRIMHGGSFRSDHGFTSLGALIDKCDGIEVWKIVDANSIFATEQFQLVEVLKEAPAGGESSRMKQAQSFPLANHKLRWDQPGRLVIAFKKDKVAAVCYGPFWRIAYLAPNDLFSLSMHSYRSDDLPQLYHGPVERLIDHTRNILAGKEVVVTALKVRNVHEYNHLRMPSAPAWRLKASLKITQEAQTIRAANFVGWGAGDEADIPRMVKRLDHLDPCQRWHAIDDLMSLGSRARGAIPDLENRLADREPILRLVAAQVIQRIDPANLLPLPTIVFELQCRDMDIRNMTAELLTQRIDALRPMLPAVVAAFEREPWPYSWELVTLIGRLGAQASSETRREIAALIVRKIRRSNHREGGFREDAIQALEWLAPDIDVAIPVLKGLVRGCERGAYKAAELIAQYSPDGPVWLAEMIGRRHYGEIHRAFAVAKEQSHEAIPVLVWHLNDDRGWVRCKAAAALVIIDRDAHHDRVRHAIEGLLESDDRDLSDFARVVLHDRRIVRIPVEVETAEDRRARRMELMELIRSGADRRWQAATALANYGPEARDVAPELWRLLKSEKTADRASLVVALWKIDGYAQSGRLQRDCRPALLAELRTMLHNQESFNHRWSALWAVQELGIQAMPLVADVMACLSSPDLTAMAVRVIAIFGPAAKDAVPQLLRVADRDVASIQKAAIVALCRVTNGDAPSIQRLKEWCESESYDILLLLKPSDFGSETAVELVIDAIKAGRRRDQMLKLLEIAPEAKRRMMLPMPSLAGLK